ncbi:hypothetical protein EBR25_12195 [bacterium]|nr:hypothetical protein [bacterium]
MTAIQLKNAKNGFTVDKKSELCVFEIVLRGHGNCFYINLMSLLLVVRVVENRLCFFPLNFHSMAGIL